MTTRIVEIDTAWWAGDHCYFKGWCRLREDWRTFRVDRVLEAWLDGTPHRGDGWALIAHLREVSSAPVVAPDTPPVSAKVPVKRKQPPQRVRRPPITTPLGSVDAQADGVEQVTAMVFLLVYLARADGRFEAKEKESIRPILSSWSRGIGEIPPGLVDLARIQVDHNEFRQALAALVDAPQEIKVAVLTAAVRVAEASAGVKEDEAAVLRQIEAGLYNRMAHPHRRARKALTPRL